MGVDQYRYSIEARPLQALYSKYRDGDVNTTLQVVRPLGCVRKDKKSNVENRAPDPNKTRIIQSDTDDGQYVASTQDSVNKECIKRRRDTNMLKSLGRDRTKHKHENNGSKPETLQFKEEKDMNNNSFTENDTTTFGNFNRSKSQLFEHRFRIAASRVNGQESPSPTLKRSKVVKKRVIQLPLFRVNLKTCPNESEVTRTVARTRESLRQLMELHRTKMKTPNMVAANIKNYEFSTPSSPRIHSHRCDQTPSGLAMSQPFPAKPAIKPVKSHRNIPARTEYKFGGNNKPVDQTDAGMRSLNRTDGARTFSLLKQLPPHDNCIDDDDEGESFLTNGIRPETALTLASTMSHMDGVLKSPGSDELREISDVFTNTETIPAWPNFDDYQRLKTQSHVSRYRVLPSFTRSSTGMMNYQKDLLPHASTTPHNMVAGCSTSTENGNDNHSPQQAHAHKPVLRYTSKQSTYKLDPIVVPSHTCTICSMCNIYERDFETPCPPNSPMSTQLHLNPDSVVKERPSGNRSVRSGRQDVLQVTRINMSGTPADDFPNNFVNSMKASG